MTGVQTCALPIFKVICGTDTLGVGINVPIRTVLFTALSKYDGRRSRLLRAREFHQIAGRAGRAGFDTIGYVAAQAPDHVIENERALAKIGDDPKRRRGYTRKKPPEGFVNWSEQTFEKLIEAEPEPLVSRFQVTHAMLLAVIARPGNAFEAMRKLLTDNHEPRSAQRKHIHRAIAIYRSLLDAGVVERLDTPDDTGRIVRLTVDLQQDFAMNQALSTFALAAFDLLDPEAPSYALDLLSIIESILDDPRQILVAQEKKARGEAIAEMKASGIEYEERMERVADISYPKPLDEMLGHAYDTYRRAHPWIGDHPVSPKSVVREMYEQAMTFSDYIAAYDLARVEGIVLRYLADAYRTLSHTIPESVKVDDLVDLIEWLGETVRQIDSSLVDEWEALRNPEAHAAAQALLDDSPPPVTGNRRAFRVLVRNALFRRVELAARDDVEGLVALDAEDAEGLAHTEDWTGPWEFDDWDDALGDYFDEHEELGTGPDARGPKLIVIDEAPETWKVRQILDDPAGNHDWQLRAEVDLPASDAAGRAILRVLEFDRFDG